MMSVVTSGRASQFMMDDFDEESLGQTVDDLIQPLRFHKCGHAHHTKCLKNHLNEKL